MSTEEIELVSLDKVRSEMVRASGADMFLARIRPEWQAKSLIQRVKRLLPVDASSACQRLFNAAIHDLRQKIIMAGIDIAAEAAERYKLPPVASVDDILENYSTARIIDLAYRMGLLSRAEWRRLTRSYEIRRDLEHEDDQYEAEIEDILYIFKSTIEIVLSRDPVEVIRLSDVNDLIEAPQSTIPSEEFLHEYEVAPETRQRQIVEHLINVALNSKKADIIRQNAVELLRYFSPLTRSNVKVEIAQYMQGRIGSNRLELVYAKVAHAAGILPYLKQRQVKEFFEWMLSRLEQVGYTWRSFKLHSDLLDDLDDVGGLVTCPDTVREKMVLWMTLCYLGEPGGYGTFGKNRQVFYSNTAAPRIKRMFKESKVFIRGHLLSTQKDPRVKAALMNKYISRRFESLLDIVEGDEL
ncbi:hypothetical protein D6779_10070 [Candidatus Parcubacteria bacterium]|nr:MAG: hypothetical protein D6779_10070 [Candidatus Parcubacteria bacterium]